MSDPIDWAALGRQAQKRAESEAAEMKRSAERAKEDSLAKAAFRAKATSALLEIRNACERNCGAYNANVSDPAHRVSVTETRDGFLVSFRLDPLRSRELTLTRENSMKHRNLHTDKLEALEADGKVYFGTSGVDFTHSDSMQLANDACRWVMETLETAYK